MTQIYAKLEQDDESQDSTSRKAYSYVRTPISWRSCTSLCDPRSLPTPSASLPSVKRAPSREINIQRLENSRSGGWGSASCLINQKRRRTKHKGLIGRHKSQILTLLQLNSRSMEKISSDPSVQISIYKPHIYKLVDRSLIGAYNKSRQNSSSQDDSGDRIDKNDSLIFTIYL